jgi:hypothetical protein
MMTSYTIMSMVSFHWVDGSLEGTNHFKTTAPTPAAAKEARPTRCKTSSNHLGSQVISTGSANKVQFGGSILGQQLGGDCNLNEGHNSPTTEAMKHVVDLVENKTDSI